MKWQRSISYEVSPFKLYYYKYRWSYIQLLRPKGLEYILKFGFDSILLEDKISTT